MLFIKYFLKYNLQKHLIALRVGWKKILNLNAYKKLYDQVIICANMVYLNKNVNIISCLCS